MRAVRVLSVLTFVLFLAGCGEDFDYLKAAEVLKNSPKVKETAQTIFLLEGASNTDAMYYHRSYMKTAEKLGWLRCETDGFRGIDCRLTPAGREKSKDWRKGADAESGAAGWFVPITRFDVSRVVLAEKTEASALATFVGHHMNNEYATHFKTVQMREPHPYSAAFEKIGEEWTVVDIQGIRR